MCVIMNNKEPQHGEEKAETTKSRETTSTTAAAAVFERDILCLASWQSKLSDAPRSDHTFLRSQRPSKPQSNPAAANTGTFCGETGGVGFPAYAPCNGAAHGSYMARCYAVESGEAWDGAVRGHCCQSWRQQCLLRSDQCRKCCRAVREETCAADHATCQRWWRHRVGKHCRVARGKCDWCSWQDCSVRCQQKHERGVQTTSLKTGNESWGRTLREDRLVHHAERRGRSGSERRETERGVSSSGHRQTPGPNPFATPFANTLPFNAVTGGRAGAEMRLGGAGAVMGAGGRPVVSTRFMSSPLHLNTSMKRFLLLMTMNLRCRCSAARSATCSLFIWINASPVGAPWNAIHDESISANVSGCVKSEPVSCRPCARPAVQCAARSRPGTSGCRWWKLRREGRACADSSASFRTWWVAAGRGRRWEAWPGRELRPGSATRVRSALTRDRWWLDCCSILSLWCRCRVGWRAGPCYDSAPATWKKTLTIRTDVQWHGWPPSKHTCCTSAVVLLNSSMYLVPMTWRCFDRAFTASSSLRNKTKASPVARPSAWWTKSTPSSPSNTLHEASPSSKNVSCKITRTLYKKKPEWRKEPGHPDNVKRPQKSRDTQVVINRRKCFTRVTKQNNKSSLIFSAFFFRRSECAKVRRRFLWSQRQLFHREKKNAA